MIYVEEKSHERQVELLSFIAGINDFKVCAWLYPESLVKKIAGFSLSDNSEKLLPVTAYEDGIIPKRTQLADASKENISAYAKAKSELKNNCDSLALYRDGEPKWAVVTIGHEGMCLVQDDSKLSALVGAGFNASTEAPSWW